MNEFGRPIVPPGHYGNDNGCGGKGIISFLVTSATGGANGNNNNGNGIGHHQHQQYVPQAAANALIKLMNGLLFPG